MVIWQPRAVLNAEDNSTKNPKLQETQSRIITECLNGNIFSGTIRLKKKALMFY